MTRFVFLHTHFTVAPVRESFTPACNGTSPRLRVNNKIASVDNGTQRQTGMTIVIATD